jgi:hypothetical protein
LKLNVHVRALVLDGAYVDAGDGTLRFYEVDPPTDDDMDCLLGTIERRLHRLLARRGVLGEVGEGNGVDAWSEESPVLAGIAAASVQDGGRWASGPAGPCPGAASAELLALAPSALGPCHARRNGFDLHAGVVVPARDRARLERLCRYALRPPIAQEGCT